MIVMMQKVVKVYSCLLENAGIQQEAIVVGREKEEGWGCVATFTNWLQKKTCLYRKTGSSPDSSHTESQDGWCIRHQV
jgi:hypothetical protein